MQVPDNLDIRLAMLPAASGGTEAFVIAAPPPLKAELALFGGKPGMSAIITHDPGMTWPDRTGERLAEAMLRGGQPVAFCFTTMADALACHARLLREAGR